MVNFKVHLSFTTECYDQYSSCLYSYAHALFEVVLICSGLKPNIVHVLEIFWKASLEGQDCTMFS